MPRLNFLPSSPFALLNSDANPDPPISLIQRGGEGVRIRSSKEEIKEKKKRIATVR